ncbi:SRPBCC family protein [Streptomyces caeni]|uniref:SRPBCC family protein n=1 Tax=Streptomyces caeni TaxID=2307231 RepID=A0ABW4IUZ6_9ACTN
MKHEVFVPVPAERLREALADPARVARAIPGLHRDAGTRPVAGRLKVRVGGHTITYRGTLRVAERGDGSFTAHGEASEARGTGTVELSLTVRVLAAEGGATVVFTGTATGDGRIAELPEEAVAAAGARLLGRFAENLGAPGETAAAAGPAPSGTPAGEPAEEAAEASVEPPVQESEEPSAFSVFDTEVPPSSLDPLADEEGPDGSDEVDHGEEPPAEAAHARRTMIGRSAEEVDHAPPRGRYAPVPAPESSAASATLRWAAPAAALLVASAIVAGRLLRRRR